MYNWLKSYFTISKREFNGMLVFIGLMIVVFFIPLIYDKIMFEPVTVKIETLQPIITELDDKVKNSSFYNSNKNTNVISKGSLFKFNPNTLPLEGWVRLGLSPKQAASILKYVSKGGKFLKAVDVKKMYAISPENYQRLEQYIEIPTVAYSSSKYTTYSTKPIYKSVKSVIVDLNEADSAMLTNIRGIGPAFALRIINYRKRLGGYATIEQLKEVYGLDSVKYEGIKDQVKINLSAIKKINLNTAEFDEMKKIPYISYKQINAIMAYRKQHGNYSQISDLNKVLILNPNLINKISDYVQF